MLANRAARSGVRSPIGRIATISNAPLEIRPSEKKDLDDLYRICLATGENGGDALHLYTDAKLIGHIYAAPYALFSPELCFVVEDEAGVGGYILGALDTRAFEALLEREWWPTLRPLYLDPAGSPPASWTADQTRSWQIHHPRPTPSHIVDPYPSHLHIDLLPRLQGRGVGRELMGRWLAKATALGSVGAHLGVGSANSRGVGFYRALGWRDLEPERSATARTTWFGMKL
jgi:GNAT superfamily N-acetyltransferase